MKEEKKKSVDPASIITVIITAISLIAQVWGIIRQTKK